jgi:hypothetical protein
MEASAVEVFCGYTHRDGPAMIGVAIAPARCGTLDTIAHECRHVAQHQRQTGWRSENEQEAERDANEYVQDLRRRLPALFSEPTSLSTS